MLVVRTCFAFALCVSAFAAIGCGGGEALPESKTANDEMANVPAPAEVVPPTPETISSIPRSKVKQAIGQGLGVFLQNVSVEDWPVMREGKFHGFRVRALNPAWGVDLKTGDVVTRVNGMVIEHPEDADAVLRSLEKAPSVRVDFEREGKARVLDLPIVDDLQGSSTTTAPAQATSTSTPTTTAASASVTAKPAAAPPSGPTGAAKAPSPPAQGKRAR